jgi:hypothetical protein
MPSILHEAGENIKDLFRLQTITVIDEHGNTVQKKAEIRPPANPITLFRKLTWKNWLYFLVGKQRYPASSTTEITDRPRSR